MSYRRWLVLQEVRTFFVWLSQPHVLTVGLVCIGLGFLTWHLINEPVFGLAVKTFFLETLPRWAEVSIAYFTRTSIQRQLSRFGTRLLQVVVFQQTARFIGHLLEERIECWKEKDVMQKSIWIGSIICLLWIPLGWWALAFFPYELLRNLVILMFRGLFNYVGLRPLLEKLEGNVVALVPKRIRRFCGRIDDGLETWICATREKLEKHRHIRRLEKEAKLRFYERQKRKHKEKFGKLVERFKEEEQL